MSLFVKQVSEVAESILGAEYQVIEENESRIIVEGIDKERVTFILNGHRVEEIDFKTYTKGQSLEKKVDLINFPDFSKFNILYVSSIFRPDTDRVVKNEFISKKGLYSVVDIGNKEVTSNNGSQFRYVIQRRGTFRNGRISNSLHVFEQESLSSEYGIDILSSQKRVIRITNLRDIIEQMKLLSKRFCKDGDPDSLVELCELYDYLNLSYYNNIDRMDEGRKLIYSYANEECQK